MNHYQPFSTIFSHWTFSIITNHQHKLVPGTNINHWMSPLTYCRAIRRPMSNCCGLIHQALALIKAALAVISSQRGMCVCWRQWRWHEPLQEITGCWFLVRTEKDTTHTHVTPVHNNSNNGNIHSNTQIKCMCEYARMYACNEMWSNVVYWNVMQCSERKILCVCMSVCRSVCLSVCPCLCLSISLCVCVCLFLRVWMYVRLFGNKYVD